MSTTDPFGLVGQALARKYLIEACVGEGGFAVVYRAKHLAFDRPVAVKCLKVPPHFTPEGQRLFLERFREEGQRLFELSEHPSIVKVFDFDTTERNVPYLVLEWLEGKELATELGERAQRGQGPYPEAEALSLVRPAVEALAHAHALGIAHRDVKPANLFLVRSARGLGLKVLDFGIAKAMQEGETATALVTKTSSGFQAF